MKRPSSAAASRTSGKTTPPVLFRSLLDKQALDLVPPAALRDFGKMKCDDDLVINPYCSFHSPELHSLPYLENFFAPNEILWILDPDRNALQPFSLTKELRTLLAGVQPGTLAPRGLPCDAVKLLRFAGVLVQQGVFESRSQQFSKMVAQAAGFFLRNRYVNLNNLFHPLHIAALRRYLRDLLTAGKLAKGRGGYQHCHLCHNEPVARFFHHQLTSLVSEITGEPVQPSFTFTLSYHGGAELSTHTDREQCEFTLSLCLDFIPEPRGRTPWPIYMERAGGCIEIGQALGDAILFCGREVPHYRKRLAEGHTSTSILFHFVRRNFDLELD